MTGRYDILIVTEMFDPHADAMILLLREMGHNPFRLHTADFPVRNSVSMELGNDGWEGVIHAGSAQLLIQHIRSVLWRRPAPYVIPDDLTSEEREFVLDEVTHTLRGLWYSLDVYWMSFPPNIQRAGYKPEQLKRAISLGFDVPRTVVTSDPDKVREFYDQCNGDIIYKAISNGMHHETDPATGESRGKAIYSTPIRGEHLSTLENVRVSPTMFQEYVQKRSEFRVTVIGDDIFVAEIDSQAQERTRYDWRHYDVPMLISEGTLPGDITGRCFELVRSYGLNFGALDLILTPDGRYVFLEINPNGQWLWVQTKLPTMKMKEAMAACLTRGKASIAV